MAILTSKANISTGFVYFFDLTRIGSFVIGSMLAVFVKRFSFKQMPYNKMTLISAGLIVILSLSLSYEAKATYYIGFLLTDLISVLMILIAYSNKDLYEDKIMARLSNYSYGTYLYHWPSFVIVSSFLPNTKGLVLAILATGFITIFNYHVFEPIFTGRQIRPLYENKISKTINYEKFGFIFKTGIIFILILSFSLAYNISRASGDMVSLEKQILKESILQDIEKIKLDKSQIDKLEEEKYSNQNDELSLTKTSNSPSLTLLGDSVILGHRQILQENIENLYINAEGSRPLENAPALIEQMENEGNLGDIIIIGLGTNAEVDPNDSLKEIVKSLPEGKKLILITCYDNRYDQPHRVSLAMKKIAKKYDFITLMEWEKEGIAHPDYYAGTDGVHFYGHFDAYQAYLELLEQAINQSIKKPGKGE